MSPRGALQRRRAARQLRGCAQVGRDVQLIGVPTIRGFGRIVLGDRFRLASLPVPSHLAAGEGATLEIGDDVAIAHGAAVAAFEEVRIGRGTVIGPYTVIMDTNFHGGPGDQAVRHETRPVRIGEGCRIGSRVTITRGAEIGDGAEILAGSVVSSAIAPGACAGGVRARVLGPAGEAAARWDGAAAWLPELVCAALGLTAAPALEAELAGVPEWASPGVERVLSELEHRHQARLGMDQLLGARSLLELAMAVERARGPR